MDHYATLEVARTASQDDIKRAFHKAAHKHHPDKGGDPEKMKACTQAYSILSNPEKRRSYDIQIGVTTYQPPTRNPNQAPDFTIFRDKAYWNPGMVDQMSQAQKMFDDMLRQMYQQYNATQARTAAEAVKRQAYFEKAAREKESEWFKQHRQNHYGI